jgi:tetratricopeptide (TPR) repeat protein
MHATRSKLNIVVFLAQAAGVLRFYDPAPHSAFGTEPQQNAKAKGYAGSVSCRECHERFHQLRSTSFHGLAMQPYSDALAKAKLTPQKEDVVIGSFRYRAEIGEGQGWVLEKGPEGVKKYRMDHALGGKNVFYFLTSLEKGKLQTLPVAYDVTRKEWIDMSASGVRHFSGDQRPEEPFNWKEWPYTLNTACYSCHVSQLSTNYDLKTDTYHTVWGEPGINCETCHGPSAEHNKIARETPKGQPLSDLKIISAKTMTTEQRNHLCVSCHAKTTAPLTPSYPPGGRFFDHLDLVTLENPDYYPDGRDLGENYTYTSWLMSPCVKSGKLDCMHCHTSSGRYRFKEPEDANKACLPCHEERVNGALAHTRHKEGTTGSQCISCHMPMTSFARMNRSDHSMLPPVPAATTACQSPNACNICHADKDAAWADRQVREWRPRDYQAPLLYRASLIDAARKRDWSRRDEMLQYITSPDRNEVFAASLIRLIPPTSDLKIAQTLLEAAGDPSPLVRAAAMESLAMIPSQKSLQAIIGATSDDFRLVRIRAASALSAYPDLKVDEEYAERIRKADAEHLASLLARSDQWSSHYNLGNYYLNRGEIKEAISSYNRALEIEPRAVMVMVNTSIAYSLMGELDKGEESLQKALSISPDNAAALFNMGLLKAELNDPRQAESYLKSALKHDPQMAQAAYNLCLLLVRDLPEEAVGFCRQAAGLRPDDPKYAYALAFALQQTGETAEAITALEKIVEMYPANQGAQALLRHLSSTTQKP